MGITLMLAAAQGELAPTGSAGVSSPQAAHDEGRAWQKQSFKCLRPEHGCYIQKCCELSLAIWTRDSADGQVREVKAVGEMDSPPARVFQVLTDYAHYTEFMPYTVGSKLIEQQGDEVIVWGMVSPPVITSRDWVTRSRLQRDGPGGVYGTTWWPEDKLGPPPQPGVVRLRVNSGSWTLLPISNGARTLATYQLATDPGGSLPAFIVKAVSTDSLPDLFQAVRRRAAAH